MSDPTQYLRDLAQSADMTLIRQRLTLAQIVRDAIAIQQVPAPTFAEEKRAALIQERFEQYALQDVSTDEVFNVYGRWPGLDTARPALLVSAHLDTVFPAETDLTVRYEGDIIHGPGLGDNSLGVAGLLALLDIFRAYDLRPASDVWFVANSREEGLGDLGGIRAAWNRLGKRLGAAIIVEGMALGRIYHAGIAVRRLRITCRAPGGHSWLHFGNPSAIHGLIELGARIITLTPPVTPRTTYNIGLIEGGHSVNSLAASASLHLDLRSETPGALAALEHQVVNAIEALQQPNLTFETAIVGNRPAGRISSRHPLVQLAAEALTAIDCPITYENGSTDANILLANGLPTVTVGISRGGYAHRLDEYIETGPITSGVWQLLLLTLSATNQLHVWCTTP